MGFLDIFFDKSKKVRKEALRRSDAYWKRLKIDGVDDPVRPCTLCQKPIPRMTGYLFSQRNVMENDKYMNTEIRKLEKKGVDSHKAQDIVWEKIETTYEDWLICETCIDKFA